MEVGFDIGDGVFKIPIPRRQQETVIEVRDLFSLLWIQSLNRHDPTCTPFGIQLLGTIDYSHRPTSKL
jgi:hypothetical protein